MCPRRTLIHAAAALGLGLCCLLAPTQARAQSPERFGFTEPPLLGLPGIDEPHTDDLRGIQERGTLRVLTSYSRMSFFLQDGEGRGFEFRLLREYVRSLNAGHPAGHDPVAAQFIPLPPDRLIPALLAGQGDIIADTMHILEGCRGGTRFTEPYLQGVKEVLVSRPGIKGLSSLEDLSGRTVCLPGKPGCRIPLVRLSRDLVERGMAPVTIQQADSCLTVEDLLELVSQGACPMTVAERHLARLWAGLSDDLVVHEGVVPATDVALGFMVREGNDALRRSLNRFLQEHRKGTKLGNIFFRRSLGSRSGRLQITATSSLERFAGYADLFKKYGAKYDIDWLLIAAQAYQESRLNHQSVSEDGAFGIMQTMPGLAKDSRIGITDLRKVENNIQAGVKYLRLLLTAYFKEPGISDQDRLRFALAAYNAGPKAINRARRLAAEQGLDPNAWFGNVARTALQSIGREPVNYVRQINVRYLTYFFARKTLELRERRKRAILEQPRTASAH